MTEQRRRQVIVGAAALALIVVFLVARRRNPATAELVPSMPTEADLGSRFDGGDWDVVSDPFVDPELAASQTSAFDALKAALEALAAKLAQPFPTQPAPVVNVVVPQPPAPPPATPRPAPPSVSTRPPTPPWHPSEPIDPGPQPGPRPTLWLETDERGNLVTRPGLIPITAVAA